MSDFQNEDYRDDDNDSHISSTSPSLESNSEIHASDEDDDEVEQSPKKVAKKINKKRNGKNKRKKKKNRLQGLVEKEAQETDDDDSNPHSKIREEAKYKPGELNPRVDHRQVISEIEKKVAIGSLINYQEISEDDMDMDLEGPQIRDPKIWRVACNRGKEAEAVQSLMFRFECLQTTDKPLSIVSAFTVKKNPGVIYVEAFFEAHVLDAIEGITTLRQTTELVESNVVPELFTPPETEQMPVQPGQWVRIRQHYLYHGDLAKVMEVFPDKRMIKCKVIPREKIPRDEKSDAINSKKNQMNIKSEEMDQEENQNEEENRMLGMSKGSRKSRYLKNKTFLAEQKKYRRGEQIPIQVSNKQKSKKFDGDEDSESAFIYPSLRDEYQKAKHDGFQLINIPIHQVITGVSGDIKIKVPELKMFYPDVQNINKLLPKIYSTVKHMLEYKRNFKVGDKVTIPDQPKTLLTVVSIPEGEDKLGLEMRKFNKETNESQIYSYTVKACDAQLYFRRYQEIVVTQGPHKNTAGTILQIENTKVTVLTDCNKTIEVSINDLEPQRNVLTLNKPMEPELALEKSSAQQLKARELIKFGQLETDIGCVLNIENPSVRVLDLNNQVRYINQLAILHTLKTRNNVAKNNYGNDIRKDDQVLVIEGIYRNNKARVLHVYKDYVYLFNGSFTKTQGIIIEKVNNCGIISSNMNQQQVRPRVQAPVAQGVSEDLASLRGQQITIKRGEWQGYRGLVTQVTATSIIVQLSAKNKTVKVPIDQVKSEHFAPQIGPGRTPHHGPGMSMRVWEDLDNRPSTYHQSPFNFQTPNRDHH